MIPVFLDFETYWSPTHTLSKMPPTEYVMHPDTEIISLAMKVGDDNTKVYFGEPEIRAALLDAVDWSDAMAIGHNMSGFDCMLLSWRLGIVPKMWGCTAAMARSRYSKTSAVVDNKSYTGVSLKKLAAELGIGNKLDLEATNTKGKRLADFTEEERNALAVYNIMDTELCASLFRHLAKGFPRSELHQIDMTTRMLVQPAFELRYDIVRKALQEHREEKRQSLVRLAGSLGLLNDMVASALDGDSLEDQLTEMVRAKLASTHQFAALLKELGVDVPMKTSMTTGAEIPALSKTDQAFLDLQQHPNPVVAEAARVRLEVKSTLLQTRLEAFIRAADACGGKLPVPLKYAGADTTGRWSGEQYNMQNLPRIPRDKAGNIVAKPSNALRLSLAAPKGHKVIVADLSGIELRVNMFLWKVKYAMELFRRDPGGADLYSYFAANDLYHIEQSEVSKPQRQVGKVAHLGLGFGAGAPTFQKVAKLMGGVDMPLDEAGRIVDAYRSAHPEIPAGWRAFQDSLPKIMQGHEGCVDPWGMVAIEKEALRLPSGRRIHYPRLRRQMDGATGKNEWVYGAGRTTARIYAGKGVENIVQALARDVVADNALAFRRETGLCPALMVHDELVYVVPDARAEELLALLQGIMRTGVSWWPELVTWSEGDVAQTYGEAK